MAVLCAESPFSPHWSLLKLRWRQLESISVLKIKFLPLVSVSVKILGRKLTLRWDFDNNLMKTLFIEGVGRVSGAKEVLRSTQD